MERPSDSATRAEWDAYAKSLGMNPADYSSKGELIAAVSETETDDTTSDDEVTVPDDRTPEEAPTGVPKPDVDQLEVQDQPSELVDPDNYATDPTPGAVLIGPDETLEDVQEDYDEAPPLITVGSWVILADTDAVNDAGVAPGTLAVVTESPHLYEDSSDLSPRRHAIQNPDLPITVRTRDHRSVTILVDPDDLSKVSAMGRSEVLPIA